MEKFRNKYRIQSHRKPGWDYSNNGMYFITIVTQNRECNLGKIVVSDDLCNSFGSYNSNDSDGLYGSHGLYVETHGRASLQSNQQFSHRFSHESNQQTVYIQLSDFGKIVNNEWLKSFEIRDELYLDEYIIMPNHLHAIVVLDKPNINTTQIPTESSKQPFIRKPKSISSFIGGFKSAINSKIDDYIDENKLNISKYNRNNHFFQTNYHDHIIRNNTAYERIKNYIISNPLKWNEDKFNPEIKSEE